MSSDLESIALEARKSCISMSGKGGCFLGASLSIVDVATWLYRCFLNVSPETSESPDRDYFLLSKGHGVPGLYAVLGELGFFEKGRLDNHLEIMDTVYWHPNREIPGIEFHSGSLGHALSVACGVAKSMQIDKTNAKAIVLMGDGELNEGSVWESAQVAASQRLENLIAIIDRNGFQANTTTEKLSPLEPLEAKFKAFNWRVATCNGHDFDSIQSAFESLTEMATNKPGVVIAETIRGKGVPSIEQKALGWFVKADQQRVESMKTELSEAYAK